MPPAALDFNPIVRIPGASPWISRVPPHPSPSLLEGLDLGGSTRHHGTQPRYALLGLSRVCLCGVTNQKRAGLLGSLSARCLATIEKQVG